MPARVASADETRSAERSTIEAGISSAELMRRAGHAASMVIAKRYEKPARAGVLVFTGPGNNGGDGWVVAEHLARSDFAVSVVEVGTLRSDESIAARDAAMQTGKIRLGHAAHGEHLIVDALLGTGASGAPRGEIANAIAAIDNLGQSGATIVSLDVPSGLDATTGVHQQCVKAHATISFGVAKRGHLIARDVCGEITV